jgi:D-glycero-D-manno-heptose 1,7-bisphosphate phosphatase
MPIPDAALLDRDGTINVKAPDGDYIAHPAELVLLPGAGEAIRALNDAGIPVVVVTNQRGIALGRMTEADLAAVHRRLAELLAANGARLDAVFHCPHHAGTCACRKPGTLLLERAREHLGLVTLGNSIMIGDSDTDVLAGRAAGARTVRLGDELSLLGAVRRVLAESASPSPHGG